MIRAVVDTNVTISGLLFGGLPLRVIEEALTRKFTWVTSPLLMEETRRVLKTTFELSNHEVQILTGAIFEKADIIHPIQTIDLIKRCPQDNRVLECAVEGNCSIIVTGDRRDLLILDRYQQIEIITVRHFLNRV